MKYCIQGQPELGKGRASCSYLVLVHIFISRNDDALLYPGLGEPPFHSLCEEKESSHPCPSSKGTLPQDRNSTSIPSELLYNSEELPLPLTRGEVRHTAAHSEGEELGTGTKHRLQLLSSLTELLLSLQNHRITQSG